MGQITLKSRREIERMRAAGRINALVFEMVAELLKPGITTGEVDLRVEELIRKEGARPSFKGYHGFPGSICASVNEEIVHGIPGDRILEEGDLFSIDVGVFLKGYHGDAARTFPVGKVSRDREALAVATLLGLDAGIRAATVGSKVSDISAAVEREGRSRGYGIIEEYVGHGIGTKLHEEPQVPNFVGHRLLRDGRSNPTLAAGLVLAIEPMFALGTQNTRTLADDWTVVTADGKCAAHFEDTIAITDEGPQILTRRDGQELSELWLGNWISQEHSS